MSENKERIILGSGSIFVVEVAADQTYEPAAIKALKIPANRLGRVSGGASIEYKPTFYSAKDDLGYVEKTIITDEEATLKSGIMTFIIAKLGQLCATATEVKEDDTGGTKVIKFGGINRANGKSYVVIFSNEDKEDKITTDVVIRGQNQSGFTLAFAKDKETVVDAEFKALPQDEDGTLITYIETTITAV